jgi:hypothetical protein
VVIQIASTEIHEPNLATSPGCNKFEYYNLMVLRVTDRQMKSAFGSKRKARKIEVEDDEEDSGAKIPKSLQDDSGKYSKAIALNMADSNKPVS